MDRRSFLALIAGSFTLKLLPMSGVAKDVFVKLPPFDPSKIRWSPFLPWVDQPYIVSRGMIQAEHYCRCGKRFDGLHAPAIVRENDLGKPLGMVSLMRKMDEAKANAKDVAVQLIGDLWREAQESGLVRHLECPLQPEAVRYRH